MKKKICSLLFFCIYACSNIAVEQQVASNAQPWITVFVHGIMSVKYHVSFPNIVLFIRDKIANSAYQKTVELIREDPYFHQSHPIQEAGLKKIDTSIEKPGAATSLFARLWDKMDRINSQESKSTTYYTFGWTGLLSPTVRRFESQVLYKLLQEELKTYHQQNIFPKVRVVGYSHGGNVALEMANSNKNNTLIVDELILIAAPVVKSNDFLLSDKMFKKIYHIYSNGDRVQNLDLLSWQRWFVLPKGRRKNITKLPDHLTQIQWCVKRLTAHHLNKAPRCEKGKLLGYQRRAVRTADPGHTEFWAFGWGTSSYSKYNPFFPLPAGIFTPYVINSIKNEPEYQDHIIADIYTHEHSLTLRHKQKKHSQKIDFISKETLDSMLAEAKKCEPLNYSIKEYDKRVNEAKKQGKRLAKLEEKVEKALKAARTT